VHLKVASVDRAIAFYRDVLGFTVTQHLGDQAVARVLAAGIALDGAADHGVSEAVYLRDPDDNGVELYRDRAPKD
jgi:catechol 2,3-dioxygenase